jgi:hypothetical protein
LSRIEPVVASSVKIAQQACRTRNFRCFWRGQYLFERRMFFSQCLDDEEVYTPDDLLAPEQPERWRLAEVSEVTNTLFDAVAFAEVCRLTS